MQKLLQFLQKHLSPPTPPVTKRIEPADPHQQGTIVLNCQKKDIDLLDSLSRYLELPYPGVLSKGVWLLTLARDAEIRDQKLAIVAIDEESGKITSVSPINI